MPPLGVLCRNIAVRFNKKKLEWWVYQMVKKFENRFTHFDRIHKRNRQTDRQTDGHAQWHRLCLGKNNKHCLSSHQYGVPIKDLRLHIVAVI